MVRPVSVCGGLVALLLAGLVAGFVLSTKAPAGPPSEVSPAPVGLATSPVPPSGPPTLPPPPPPKGIDGLLATLTDLRARKAELEKAEQKVLVELRQALRQQRQALERLGISSEEVPPSPSTSGGIPTPAVRDGGPLNSPAVPPPTSNRSSSN